MPAWRGLLARFIWLCPAGEWIWGRAFEAEEAWGGAEAQDLTTEKGIQFIGTEQGWHAVVDGFNERIGRTSDHAEASAVFGGFLPDSGGPKVIDIVWGEAMGGLLSGFTRPLIVGDHRDEAAALFESRFPDRAVQLVVTAVDDGFAPGTCKAPAHGQHFIGSKKNGCSICWAQEAKRFLEADQFGSKPAFGGGWTELVRCAHGSDSMGSNRFQPRTDGWGGEPSSFWRLINGVSKQWRKCLCGS
jgi:hypothetical protein